MKRRAFLKCTGLCGASVSIPTTLTMSSLLNEAYAASPDYNAVNYSPPDTDFLAVTNAFPQVINIFLYGGPSELAGNLTNIQELENTSQNSYEDRIGGITEFQSNGGLISPNGFWLGAGGDPMEFLLTHNHMSVYRTMMKRAEDTQSHQQSIFMNQKGTLDIDNSPGIGTRIAKMLEIHAGSGITFPHPTFGNRPLDELVLPFVSFEGETVLYAPDLDEPLNSLRLKAVTMNENFENPYTRDNNGNDAALNNLVNAVQTAAVRRRYSKVYDSFRLRSLMESFIDNLQDSFGAALPVPTDADDLLDDVDAGNGNQLIYPNTSFARQIRAAVTLAIENPDSKFITISNGGLGGFDDHNNGIDNYPQRMEQLFTALRVAMKHIKYSGRQTPGVTLTPGGAITGLSRRTDNIIINVFGDFGRRVNLNGSMGWDHGNCQILYTLGGQSVRTGASPLGKVVGSTRRIGQANSNDQYLVPTSSSYEFEPMSMAASIYRYFGAQNPQVMTEDPVFYPSGRPAINEGVAGEAPLF